MMKISQKQLAAELKASKSTVSRLITRGVLTCLPGGGLDRERSLRRIVGNTSGSAGGWSGSHGRASLRDRAQKLLGGDSEIDSLLGLCDVAIEPNAEIRAYRKLLDLILSKRDKIPAILAAIGCRDAALLDCADDVFANIVLGFLGEQLEDRIYDFLRDDIPTIQDVDIKGLFKKYGLKLTPEVIDAADKMADRSYEAARS
jgi:hypothetical protein